MKVKFIFWALIVSLIIVPMVYAWNGEPICLLFIDRSQIEQTATNMTNVLWTPKNSFTVTNWNITGGLTVVYLKGNYYTGVIYNQKWLPDNLDEFLKSVNNTSGGNLGTSCGSDCSGFVSISWKLPTRYTTVDFENDALTPYGYVTSLGPKGTGRLVGLKLGDALVDTTSANLKHIVLVYQVASDYIWTMEQTPNRARKIQRFFKDMPNYRPIRRNGVR